MFLWKVFGGKLCAVPYARNSRQTGRQIQTLCLDYIGIGRQLTARFNSLEYAEVTTIEQSEKE